MAILFVGCGNMGSAIVKAMLASGFYKKADIEVVLPTDSAHLDMVKHEIGLKVHHHYPQGQHFDAVLMAVKPQTLPEVMEEFASFGNDSKTLIISIAAGKSIKFFERFLPTAPIVRLMPNINLTVGRGAAAAIGNRLVGEAHRELVEKIFSTTGYFTWLDDEALIDVVVGVSGSSPAYYFLFTELLAQIAAEHGLPEHIAKELAEEAMIGSALIKDATKKPLAELRSWVTSHKGTTQAALDQFGDNNALYALLNKAFEAAIKRSKELSE